MSMLSDLKIERKLMAAFAVVIAAIAIMGVTVFVQITLDLLLRRPLMLNEKAGARSIVGQRPRNARPGFVHGKFGMCLGINAVEKVSVAPNELVRPGHDLHPSSRRDDRTQPEEVEVGNPGST